MNNTWLTDACQEGSAFSLEVGKEHNESIPFWRKDTD
jgi:hypothetical protein